MNDQDEKLIHDWQEKVRSSFGDLSKLYQYLFETMDNFYYRYLETSTDKNLKTQQLSQGLWGASSVESDMLQALKVQSPATKEVIMELAKTVPKAQGPKVEYSLKVQIVELSADKGKLIFCAEVKALKSVKKEVTFEYDDLGKFRKGLALKLEEACSIFL
jgi:hypothetical protein